MSADEPRKKKGEAEAEEQVEAGAAPEAEEKPKRARKPRKKAEPKAAEADPEKQKQQGAEEEAEAEAAEADPDAEPPAEDESGRPKGARRRGSEVTSGRKASPARRTPDGDVSVRARARYVRTAPRKARLVIDHIRGKSVDDARAILIHTPRAASRDVLKLLDSAVANAENNHELVSDELKVGKAYVDEGPTIKRFRPRAQGRATRINKRTSHMTIELVAKD